MILHVLAEVAMAVVTPIADAVTRSVLSALIPSRRPAPRSRAPKRVIVGAGAMFDRAALYETWAEAHGLAWTGERSREYAGTFRGRPTEMVTGLVDTALPTSPSLLVRVALDGIERTTLLEREVDVPATPPALRAMASLLEVEGVRDVAVAQAFVRIRFDAFVETAVLDDGLAAFEAALSALSASRAPDAASPYR